MVTSVSCTGTDRVNLNVCAVNLVIDPIPATGTKVSVNLVLAQMYGVIASTTFDHNPVKLTISLDDYPCSTLSGHPASDVIVSMGDVTAIATLVPLTNCAAPPPPQSPDDDY